MARNIVVCLDGTGNQFGDTNSSVVKLFRCLTYDPARQLTFYHPGLGTMGAPNALGKIARIWTRVIGLATGYGYTDTLVDSYTFLMNHYEDGDRVYLFGFSRGAYMARALASVLHMFGLLREGDDILIRYAIRMLKAPKKKTWAIAQSFKQTFSRECKPYFVGVWDTVSSIGWMTLTDPIHLPYTAHNPDIAIERHAISIDERRCCFRQNLWGNPQTGQDLKQVWFAGVHCDVGGGYPENESGLSKIPLDWMLREAASAGLLLDAKQVATVLGAPGSGFATSDPNARIHTSLFGLWLLLEILPHRYYDVTKTPPRWRWKLPLGRRRTIPVGSTIDQSVITRERGSIYRPPNLPGMSN